MFIKRRKSDWALVAFLTLGFFLYASYQPRFRLRAEMPPEFIDAPLTGSFSRPNGEEKIARAYWSCLVDNIQWKYGYGHTLPVDPPLDFTAVEGPGLTPEGAANRARYWRKVQHVWYLPIAWQKNYEWDFNWTTDWIQTGGEALHHIFEHLGGG
jgi:hypothetical protein